jgi:Arc/MetJ family transcription regulator
MKRTNVVLDEELIHRGIELTGLKTQRDLIDYALRELVRRKEQKKIIQLKGAIDWQGDLNEMRELR